VEAHALLNPEPWRRMNRKREFDVDESQDEKGENEVSYLELIHI
jgi:hypothetical protein